MDTFDSQFLNKASQKLPEPGANGPEKTRVWREVGFPESFSGHVGYAVGRAPKVPIGFQPFAETTLQDSHAKPHSHAEEFYQFIGDILTYKYIRRPILLDQVYV